jgi:hypothetical protein
LRYCPMENEMWVAFTLVAVVTLAVLAMGGQI